MGESSSRFGIILALKDSFSRGAKSVSDSMKKMKGEATETTGGVNKLGGALKALAGAAIFQKSKEAFASLINPAMEFEKSLAMVNSRLQSGGLRIDEVEKRLFKISNKFGVAATEQAQGLTQMLTGGIENADKALTALETANKLAKANNVSLDVASDALLRSLNTFQLAPDQMAAAGNVIQIAAEAGTGSIQEFSMALEMGGTAVRTVGGNFLEFAAIIGTLRDQGVKGRETIAQLEATIASLQGNEKELKPFLKSIGEESVKSAVQAHGLVPVLDAIIRSVGGNREKLQQLGFAGKALDNILLITGENLAKYHENLRKYGTDTTTLSETYGKATDSMAQKLTVLKTQLENTKASLGKSLLIAMAPIIEKLEVWTAKLVKYLEEHPKFAKALALGVAGIAALGVVLGAIVTVAGVLSVVFSPVVLVILKIVAVLAVGIAWFYVLYRTAKFVGEAIGNAIVKGLKFMWDAHVQVFGLVREGWRTWYESVVGWVTGIVDRVLELISHIKFLSPLFSGISAVVGALGFGKKPEENTTASPEAKRNAALSVQTQANTELSAVGNPNISGPVPAPATVVNVPPAKIEAAPIMLDKKKLAEVIFEVQRLQTVRATG